MVAERFSVEHSPVLETPPRRDLGDLAAPAALHLARTLRRKPRDIATEIAAALDPPGRRRAGDDRRRRLPQLPPRPADGGGDGSGRSAGRPLGRAAAEDHRRAHQHQPQQGGPRRPPAQRRARRHPDRRAARAGLPGRGPELHRRHRRPARRRGGRLRRPAPASASSEVERHPRALRLLLLGPLQRGRPLVRGGPARASGCAARPCTQLETRRGRARASSGGWSPAASSRRHLATMRRLGIGYDLLTHESEILRLEFFARAFERLQRERRAATRERRQERRLLGDAARRERGVRGPRGARQGDRALRRHASPTSARTSRTSSGSSACSGRDFGYRCWDGGGRVGDRAAQRSRRRAPARLRPRRPRRST